VGNLSKENCSVDGWFGNSIHTNSRLTRLAKRTRISAVIKYQCLTDVSQHTPYSLVIICAFEIKTILNGFMFLSYYAMFFFESAIFQVMVYISFYIFIVGSCEDIIRPPWETLVRKIVQWMDDSETAYTQIVVWIIDKIISSPFFLVLDKTFCKRRKKKETDFAQFGVRTFHIHLFFEK
jgi:hypothetical protein